MSAADEQQAAKMPAIRTMHSDTELLLREKKFSLGDLVRTRAVEPLVPGTKREQPAVLLLSAVLIAAALGGGIWWGINFFKNPAQAPPPPQSGLPTSTSSPSAFPIDQTRTIRAETAQTDAFLRLVREVAEEPGADRAITKIAVTLQDGPNERPTSVSDIFDFYRINSPEGFVQKIVSLPILFVHRKDGTPRLGIAFQIRERDRAFADMLSWENAMPNAFRLFFFDDPPPGPAGAFSDRTFRNIDWRFLPVSEDQDRGLGYAILPTQNLLVIATSRSTMEEVITRFLLGR